MNTLWIKYYAADCEWIWKISFYLKLEKYENHRSFFFPFNVHTFKHHVIIQAIIGSKFQEMFWVAEKILNPRCLTMQGNLIINLKLWVYEKYQIYCYSFLIKL